MEKELTGQLIPQINNSIHIILNIFKYLNSADMRQMRLINRAAYQIWGIQNLRSQLHNYADGKKLAFPTLCKNDPMKDSQYIKFWFKEIGKNLLNFEKKDITNSDLKYLAEMSYNLPNIEELYLSIIYIYIYVYIDNVNLNREKLLILGVIFLIPQYTINLRVLSLSNIIL